MVHANDPVIQQRLDQDMADGVTLRIAKMPSFFVNGKPLLDFGPHQLKNLVEAEVRGSYAK